MYEKRNQVAAHASDNEANDGENLLEKTSDLPAVPLIGDELFVGSIERIRESIAGPGIVHFSITHPKFA
jgi:hypothetical protein